MTLAERFAAASEEEQAVMADQDSVVYDLGFIIFSDCSFYSTYREQVISEEELAYDLFSLGWTIPDIVRELGIEYPEAEEICRRYVRDRAEEKDGFRELFFRPEEPL